MEGLTQCANHSVGPANQLFGLLIQTLLAAQCSISPPDMWPKDFGPTAIEKGTQINIFNKSIIKNNIDKRKYSVVK